MTGLPRIRALLYDFDHTLVHTPIDFAAMRRGVYELCLAAGVAVEGADGKLILEVVDEAASRLAAGAAESLRSAADDHIRGIERAAARQCRALDGVAESLRRLRAEGRQVAIITRNCREVVQIALARVPLPHDLLLARDDVPAVKPDPGHALTALAVLGVQPGEAALVGDFTADMACAVAAGVLPIGVTTGSASAEKLVASGARVVLPSAAGVPGWLDQHAL